MRSVSKEVTVFHSMNMRARVVLPAWRGANKAVTGDRPIAVFNNIG